MNPFFVFAPAVFQGGSVNDTAFLRKNGRDTPGKPGIAHGFRINAITGRRHRISVFCRPAIRTSEERQDMPAVRYLPRSPLSNPADRQPVPEAAFRSVRQSDVDSAGEIPDTRDW